MPGKKRDRKDEPEKKPAKKLDGDFLLNWTKSMINLTEDILEKRAKTADKDATQDDEHSSDSSPPSPTIPRASF